MKFLLHTCCAPCSIAIIDELKDRFDLTVFFYNPNIHPEEEYLKRKAEVVRICNEWNNNCHSECNEESFGHNAIKLVDADYEPLTWYQAVKGTETEPEDGARCSQCFALRLEKTAAYAAEHKFEVFGTSLTMGKNKKADVIHPIGNMLAKKYGINFYEEDWKKKGRQEKGRKMTAERGIYRQNYCGCRYSVKNVKNPKA